MAPQPDKDGWVKVGPSRGELHRRRKEEEAAKERAKKAEQEQAAKGFNTLVKTPKPVEAKPVEEKKPKTEAEKAAARKLRKKEKDAKRKEEVKAKPYTAPKAQHSALDKIAARIPGAVVDGIRELPEKYPGRVKDQYHTAVLYLNDLFPAGTTTAKNYKALSAGDKWAQPLASDAQGTLAPLLHAIIDQSPDDAMWNSMSRELISDVFGRDGCRADEGSHYLGSKFALQVLLQHRPEAFLSRPEAVEGVFLHEGGTMVASAAINFGWVLAQLPDSAACVAVESWARVYFGPRIAANDGKVSGPASEVAMSLAEHLAARDPSDEVRKQYLNSTRHHDPLEKQLFEVLALIAPKMNRPLKLFKLLLPKFSMLFTSTSPHGYFARLMHVLRTANDINRPLVLDLLVEGLVLDTGCLYAWSNDFLTLVPETSELLAHICKNQAVLSDRLDGAEMKKLFEQITTTCDGVLAGTVARPTGKKAKFATYTEADVQAVRGWVRKASGLSKAVPKNAPATNKKAQQKLKRLEAEGKPTNWGATLFVLLVTVVLALWLSLPYLPQEHAVLIQDKFNVAGAAVRHHSQVLIEAASPHVERAAAYVKAQLS